MQHISPTDFPLLVTKINQGATVIFPTETSYGLGCDATNVAAVNKIFAIKGRDPSKPLLVVVPTIALARCYLVWNETLERLSQKYWPGPLTIVGHYQLPTTNYKLLSLARGVVASDGTVAIRVTADPWLRQLTSALGHPLVATSANQNGQPALYDSASCQDVFSKITSPPEILVDAGTLSPNPATTLVRVVGGKPIVLRQGEIIVDYS